MEAEDSKKMINSESCETERKESNIISFTRRMSAIMMGDNGIE